MIEIHDSLVRSLRGRCVETATGILSYDGQRHENCATCEAICGKEDVGFSGGVQVNRKFGTQVLELAWACPSCGANVIQDTTALMSIIDAEEVKKDPLCYRCRPRAHQQAEIGEEGE